MPYGTFGSPDEPKSGCSFLVAPPAEPTHAADRACTGSAETSACHTLSAGNSGHAEPGTDEADATPPLATTASAASRTKRRTGEVSAVSDARLSRIPLTFPE